MTTPGPLEAPRGPRADAPVGGLDGTLADSTLADGTLADGGFDDGVLDDGDVDDEDGAPGRRRAFVRTVGVVTVAAMVLATLGTTIGSLLHGNGPVEFSLAAVAVPAGTAPTPRGGLGSVAGREAVVLALPGGPPGTAPAGPQDPSAGTPQGAAACSVTVRRGGAVVGETQIEVLWRAGQEVASIVANGPPVLVAAPAGRSSRVAVAVAVTGAASTTIADRVTARCRTVG